MASSLGRLRHQVKLQSPTRTTDAGGGQAISWSTLAELYADVRPKPGSEDFQHGQLQERTQHEVTIRFRSDISTAYRVLFGSRILNIRHIQNVNERDRFLILTCEEGVAA